MKIKKGISLGEDTNTRLLQHAKQRHTNVSQLITNWTWQIALPDEQNSIFDSTTRVEELKYH